MLQRHFAGDDLHLWSFDKRHPERGVKRKPIALLFREWHLYTVRRPDGTRDTSTETRLSVIEGRAEPVVTRIISNARAGRTPTFTERDRRALANLFVAQFRRSPDFHRGVLTRQAAADIVADGMARWEAVYGPATEKDRAFLTSDEYAARVRRDAIAEGAADPLLTATATMLQRGFSVARISLPRRSFVLGSSPFARFKAHETHRQDLGDPRAELWLPIAHDVALISYGLAGSEQLFEVQGDRAIRQVNETIVRASTVFASANRDLVEALARRIPRGMKLHGKWKGPDE
jgi:hypothetical protein